MMKPATSRFKRALLLVAFTSLTACGGSGGGDSAASAVVSPPVVSSESVATSRTVTGVVSKGPVSGATISIYAVDADGFRIGDAAIAQTVTDATGNWVAQVNSTDGLLIVSAGGSYVDESDDQPDPQNRRTVTLAANSGFEAYLPDSLNTTPLNVYTMSLLRRSRLQNTGGEFLANFASNRQALVDALGFDPVAVNPSDPIAPAATDSLESRQYAMALGGAANAINSLAIALGEEVPNFAIIDAMVDDLTDCAMDAQAVDGTVMVQTANGDVAAISGQDLNAQILRFRNNNFAAYENTALLVVDPSACDSLVVVPDNIAPLIAIGDALTVNAVNASGTPSTAAAIAALLDGATATDNRPGPITLTNDVPAVLPIGATTITFSATDIAGNSAGATVVVTVADLQAPVITAPAAVSITATGTLTSVVLGQPQVSDNVSAPASLQVVNDAPSAGFTVGDTVVVWTVTDEAGLSASATQTISVLPEPPPDPVPPALTAPIADALATEGIAFTLDAGAAFFDPDSALVFTLSGLPADTGIGIDPVSGLLSGTPLPADVAASPLLLTVTASDGMASASDSFLLSITDVNAPPTFSISGDLTLGEDFATTEVVQVIPATVPVDEVSQTVTYSLSPPAADVTLAAVQIDPQTGAVSVTSLPDANGQQVFTVTADDGQAQDNTFSATFTLTVDAVNDAPAFVTSGDVIALEDFAGTMTVTITPDAVAPDEAAQTVSYSLADPQVDFATVTIDPQAGTIFIESLPNATGLADVTIVADDGQPENSSFSQSFQLNIESANDVPQLITAIEPQITDVGTDFSLSLMDNFVDADGDTLVFELADAPSNFSLNPQTGVLSGVAQDVDALIRRFDIRITAIDTSGASTDTVFDLFVQFPDRDGDGLSDDDELLIGTNPDNPDTDGDGVGDRIETDTDSDPLIPAGAVYHVSPDGDNAASGLSWLEAKANNAGLIDIPAGASPASPTYILYAGNLEGLLASADWALVLSPPCDNIHLVGSQEPDDFATKLTPAGGPATRFAAAGGTALTIDGCNNVVVSNIEFTGATDGAVVSSGANVTLEGVVIRDNLSLLTGAGLRVNGGSLTLLDSTVSANGALIEGAGLHASGAAVINISNSRFEGNAVLGNGGAVYLEGTDAGSSVFNSTFTGNRAGNGAALALADSSGTQVTNVTARFNQADLGAAAIWFDGTGTGPEIRDSVLVDNFLNAAPSVFNAAISAAMSSYNLLDLPVGGTGSIDALLNDPQLTAAGFLDQALSPAIDAGSTTAENAGLASLFTDPDRFDPLGDLGLVDLGAHSPRPYNGGADDYDEPLAIEDTVNLRPGLGPQPVIISPTRNGQSIGAGHQLIATTDNPDVAQLLSVTAGDPLGNNNSVLLVDLGNGDYSFAADAGIMPGEVALSIYVDGEFVDRQPPVILRQCSPPVVCDF